MLRKLSNSKFVKGNEIAGISITLADNGTLLIDGCILAKKKNKVILVDAFFLENLEGIKDRLSKNTPINLHIDGKGVIHKQVDSASTDIKKILPNADISNLYMDSHEPINGAYYKSIVRKSAVDAVIQELQKQGFVIQSIAIGPQSYFSFKELFPELPHIIHTRKSTYQLNSSGEIIIHSENPEQNNSVDIANEQLNMYELIPYLSALLFFINPVNLEDNKEYLPQLNFENFIYKKLFGYARWGVLGFFFILLLLNYFIFDSISRKTTVLQTESQSNNQLITEIRALTRELEQKETMILESGLSSQSQFSLLADKIGLSVPRHIALMAMSFSPIAEQLREGEEIQVVKKTVLIEGSARNSLELNDWLKILRKENWIEKIDILNYEHDYGDKYGTFEIRIKIAVKS
jgi:Tfp pilus assembly protein PilN